VTLILLGIFSHALEGGAYGQLDAIWRLQIGLALVPAFATLWQRLTMPEGKKFLLSTELSSLKTSSLASSSTDVESVINKETATSYTRGIDSTTDLSDSNRKPAMAAPVQAPHETQWGSFFVYFSEWRHLKILIGTASCWFLVDVAYYGLNLNQSVLLAAIGFSTGKTEYLTLVRNAYGNLIIAVAGLVPGYFFTVYFIEILGRRWIQIQGFLICALMFAIIAGDYVHLGTAGKFTCFVIAQVSDAAPRAHRT